MRFVGRGECCRADLKIHSRTVQTRPDYHGESGPGSRLAGRSGFEPSCGREQARDVEFNRDIRPILSENCYACHGPDKNQRKAKLRLDDRDSAVGTRPSSRASPTRASWWLGSSSDDAEQVMPPPATHKTLSAAQKDAAQAMDRPGGRVPGALGLCAAGRAGRAHRQEQGLGPQPDRRVHPQHAGIEGHHAVARGRPARP